MRGPKLFLVAAALVACACDHGPASSEELPIPAEPISGSRSVELPRTRSIGREIPALDAMPWGLERIAIEQALGASDARFAPRMGEGGPTLETPGSVVATFSPSGARLAIGRHEITLRAIALGRGDAMRPLDESASPQIDGADVSTDRGAGVVEWWRSLPSGLEHGITIAERPTGDGELVVAVAATGALSARALSDDAVEFRDSSGARVATYAHLVVLDADGARVPARMTMDGDRIALAIDDTNAHYPIVVDPLLVVSEEATLLASSGASTDWFGYSVALSADGTRALVGAHHDDNAGGAHAGSAWVFLRTGTTWTEEAALFASDGEADDWFGWSVALSSDASRALVGSYRDGAATGSARVFARIGTNWTQEATLLASDGMGNDMFGWSVALSSDGSRALVGVYNDGTVGGAQTGSARVFVRGGSTWTEEATLLAPDGAMFDQFGVSVALSGDGSRALVGANGDDTAGGTEAGSARIFARTGSTWAEEALLLAPGGGASNDMFGVSVSLSGDASRALVGANGDDNAAGANAGSALVFVRTGTSWTREATLLPLMGGGRFGVGLAVAISADANRTLLGNGLGSALVFLRSATTWTQEATVSGDAVDYFGYSVALSADGSRGLVGEWEDDTVGGPAAGSVHVLMIESGRTNGVACSADAQCVSAFCTDGVCCDQRCGPSTEDCQACSGALTGGAAGVCAPLSGATAPTVTCRPAAGGCDVEERCSSSSVLCPPDTFTPLSTICRAGVSVCGGAARCTGTGPQCPPEAIAPPGEVCRASAGACDPAELCDGLSPACPGDVRSPAGARCGGTVEGSCSTPGVCNGVNANCGGGTPLAAGTVCSARVSGVPCDADDLCDGVSDVCAARYAPATTPCGAAPTDTCDAPDECTGASGECLPSFLSGVECRASNGGCDPAEVCAGASASCPPDAILPAGVSCRASTDTRCDPEEMCDGSATACPADVTMCTPMPDGGPLDGGSDAGPPLDAPVSRVDAGPPPVAAEGCGCRVGARPATSFGTVLGLLLGVAVLRRSRRN